MKKFSLITLIIFVVALELIGYISSLVAGDISGQYQMLNQPPFAPPGIVFAIVWPVLYLLLGISAYLIYKSGDPKSVSALITFAAGIALNFLWSPVFFGLDMYGAALVIVILMIIVTIAVIDGFRKISPAAAWLNVPYLLWLIYATYLNIGTVVLN